MKQLVHAFTLFFLLFFSSCTESLVSFVPVSVDNFLGEQVQVQLDNGSMGKILAKEDYPEAYAHLDRITQTILNSGKITHKDDFNWQVQLVEDDSMLNAFCLPGGKIVVFTGIVKYLDSEDALAGVLAHEIAHADLRHGTGQMLKSMGISLLLKAVLGIDNSSLVNLGIELLGLTFSRADETQADLNSVRYLYETEYDARGAARFFEKINEKGGQGVPEFVSTHPNPDKRVEKIEEEWKNLGGKKGQAFEKRYKEFKSSLP